MALSSLRTDDGINAGGYQNVFPPPCSLCEKGSVSWPGKAPSDVPAPIYTWLSVWSSLKTCLLLLVCLHLPDTRLWSTQPTLAFIHIKKESTRTHLLSLSLSRVRTHTPTHTHKTHTHARTCSQIWVFLFKESDFSQTWCTVCWYFQVYYICICKVYVWYYSMRATLIYGWLRWLGEYVTEQGSD